MGRARGRIVTASAGIAVAGMVIGIALVLRAGDRPGTGDVAVLPGRISATSATSLTSSATASVVPLSPQTLRTARAVAGAAMTAPGPAKVVEVGFERAAAAAWPGERPFGDSQDSYRGHPMLVVQVDHNVRGVMRQAPPVPGRSHTPPPPIGVIQVFYDVTLRQTISSTSWPAGSEPTLDLARLGRVVTFDVPADAVGGTPS